MAKRLQHQRVLFLVLLLGTAFAGLGYRLVDLQIFRHDVLSAEAVRQSQRKILREPRRGDILDARGNLLATSVFVKTVCANPALLGNNQAEVARAVAPLLGMDEDELYNRLLPRLSQNEKGQTATNAYVRLKQKVPIETWEKIREVMSRLTLPDEAGKSSKTPKKFLRDLRAQGIFAERLNDQQRIYPNQSLAAHVLGYVGQSEREVNGVKVAETSGKDGVEASFNSNLAGVGGWRMTETDQANRELVALRDQDVEPRDGWNVVLTIDSVLQNILETALVEGMEKHTPISITGLVVRPSTGEVLAMATLPTYDPNNLSPDADARRNRVIADLIEPGSTFKIVVVSGALNDGVVSLNDVFNCEHGHFAFAGRVLHDHDSHGDLSVEKIITHSSNIGAAKVGIKLGPDRLYNYIRDLGFGERTGIPLLGERIGMVNRTNWTKVSIAQIPMGQGVAVTRLQMAMAMAAIANGGVLMRPMLVDRLEDHEGNVVAKYAPQQVRRAITENAAAQMVKALKTVVSPEGTAPKAALEHYTVAGKTGTAQKIENGTYASDKFISSFIGFFPADNPELCISIVMDEPKQGRYGGLTAAPVFKQVAERAANYLNIRPDLNEKATSPAEIITAAPDPRPIKAVAARPLKNQ